MSLARKLLRGAAVGGAAPSFTFVTSGGGTTSTITIPGTPTAGDLCVIWNWCRNGVNSGGLPSLFTQLQSNLNAIGNGIISAKILSGSETTVTGFDGDNRERWIAATFHPSSPISGFTWNSPNGEVTAGNPASQSIAASGATTPVLLLGQMAADGTVNPRTTSPTMSELNNHSQADHYAHYFIANPGDTPANTSYDMDDEGPANFIQSGYLTFS